MKRLSVFMLQIYIRILKNNFVIFARFQWFLSIIEKSEMCRQDFSVTELLQNLSLP